MPSIRVASNLNNEMYFVTLTVRNWYYILDRHHRFAILADSLKYCQKEKGLKVYGYVFMLNHIHLIVQSVDVGGFLRDFKRFTAREIMKNITATEPGLLHLFESDQKHYEFWEKTNMPILIETHKFFHQKLDYIHDNPVVKEYVSTPEYWYWSSAGYYLLEKDGPILIESDLE